MGGLCRSRHAAKAMGGSSMQSFSVSLAPSQLTQAINPWTWNFQGAQFSLFNVNLGQSSDPALERQILDDVGSYGRQIGQIGDALGVILRHVDLGRLSDADAQAIDLLKGQLAQIAQLKHERKPAAVPISSAA
jgi:hypothetical protein